MSIRMLTALLGLALAPAAPVAAQTPGGPPVPAVEFSAGHAGFLDESAIGHGLVGGSARLSVSPRVSIGPEVVYMRGPGFDRDLFLTGNLTFDLRRSRAGLPRRVVPFLVVGGGAFRHSERFGSSTFSSWEGALTGGAGARAWLNDRVYGVVEVRTGWEPHLRVSGGVGMVIGGRQ